MVREFFILDSVIKFFKYRTTHVTSGCGLIIQIELVRFDKVASSLAQREE